MENILVPCKDSQVQLLNLLAIQDMIWLIDCWSVHISDEFRECMNNHQFKIHILYIPSNCTSIHQPADVILQRPFKHAFRQTFNKYTIDAITNQLKGGEDDIWISK